MDNVISSAARRPQISTRRRAATLAGVAAVTLVALLAVITTGSQIGIAGSAAGLPDSTRFDYSARGSHRFGQLRSAYVQHVLGLSGPADSPGTTGGTRLGTALGLADGTPPVVVHHPFTNRDFANAYAIPAVPFAAETDTRSESRESGEPTSCSVAGGTAWYRYVPPTSMTLQADTTGTNYATSLGVFEGTSLADLQSVACATSATGASKTGFLAIAGVAYYFQIAGPVGGGDLHFALTPHPENILITTNLRDYNKGVPDDPRIISGRGGPTPDFRAGVAPFNFSPNSPCTSNGTSSGAGDPCPQIWYVDDVLTPQFRLVSVSSSGELGNGVSSAASLSADGGFVAFDSAATNLVPGDTNGMLDVFVHDQATGVTTRESLTASGDQLATRPNEPVWQFNGAFNPFLSGDGRWLAYETNAANLGPLDTCAPSVTATAVHACEQVVLRDRQTGATTLVTAAPSGVVGSSDSVPVDITADGRYVLIESLATNLMSGPTTTCGPPTTCLALLLWDRLSGTFELESVSSNGAPANGQISTQTSMSPDGRYVTFASNATNLVADDTHGTVQTFLHDRVSGRTELVSLNENGQAQPDSQGGLAGPSPTPQFITNPDARYSSVSDDGRYVAFDSAAGLTPGVAPGLSEVYVRDRLTGTTTLVSVNPNGQPATGPSTYAVLSSDGALVMFGSAASDLVADDNNNEWDIFYRGWQQP